jgi:hemerythrin-like metal-binding protein
MHRFDLTSQLLTGNPDIDKRHLALFAVANEILFSRKLGQDPSQFRRAVACWQAHLEVDFASEELAMVRCAYLRSRFHSAFHDHVRRGAQEISVRLARDGHVEQACQAIFFLLEDWAVYHVAQADRELAEHLREHAPAGASPRLPDIGPLKEAGRLALDFDERLLAGVSGLG